MKDVVKQLDLLSRITIDDPLKIQVRTDLKTFWVIYSRMHRDMIFNPWRIINRDTQTVKTFPKASDVVNWFQKNGVSKEELQEEVEFTVHSAINMTMGNMVEINEVYSDDEMLEIHNVEVARFNQMKESITKYLDLLIGPTTEPEETKKNHLSIVNEEEEHE